MRLSNCYHMSSMISKTKKATRTTKNKEKSNAAITAEGFRFRGSEWLVLPLGLLALACLYVFTTSFQESDISLTSPAVISLLVGIFSVVFIYKALKGVSRHPVANVVAYAFSAALVALAGVLIMTLGHCEGDCNTSFALSAWLVVFNPYVAVIWLPLAVVGIVGLFVKPSSKG